MRHPLLRNGLPLESCAFDRDEDSKTIHLGAYLENKTVGVLTLLPNSKDVQLRGMAVLSHHQGEGIGRQLLAKAEAMVIDLDLNGIWMNARLIAIPNWRRGRVPEAALAAGAALPRPLGHASPSSRRPI